MTAREADIFRCVAETVVAPGEPRIADTDAVAFLDDTLAHAPAVNRIGIRGLLYALERAPLATGRRARLRRLPAADRVAVLARLHSTPLAGALEALETLAQLAYYGDDAVMRSLGYDAAAVVARCRELRAQEERW